MRRQREREGPTDVMDSGEGREVVVILRLVDGRVEDKRVINGQGAWRALCRVASGVARWGRA